MYKFNSKLNSGQEMSLLIKLWDKVMGGGAILRIVCCTVYSYGGITTDFTDFYVLFGEMGGRYFYKLCQIVGMSKRLSAK